MRVANLPVAALLTITLALTGCATGQRDVAATYTNPLLYADYSDPDVIRVGDSYYLVASTFQYSPGIPVLESRDLVHWSIVSHVVPRLNFHPAYDLPGPVEFTDASERVKFDPKLTTHRYGSGIWAPSIRFHAGRFYVYFATPTEGVFMASATAAAGPWEAPVKVIDSPGLEDPCPFWDDDGAAYLVHSKVGAGPLILHRLSADGKSVLDAGKVIVEEPQHLPVLEGPKLLKRNGYYYIFAPYGGVSTGPQAVLRSSEIYGPYEFRTVLAQGTTTIQGPHQGGYVETPRGEGWFLHFNSTGGYGRIVHMQPVTWRDDWPVVGELIAGATVGQPVTTHVVPNVGRKFPPVLPQTSDEFAEPRLGVQWEWNHNPRDSHWSLGERPGFLRLRAQAANDLVSAYNTLTQVQQGRTSQVTARLEFASMADGQRAGLAMFGKQPGWIGVVQSSGRRVVTFASAGIETTGVEASGDSIQLRMDVADESVQYSFSLDEGRSFQAFGPRARMQFSWWKGARPALFTFNSVAGVSPAGTADFDWVRFRDPA